MRDMKKRGEEGRGKRRRKKVEMRNREKSRERGEGEVNILSSKSRVGGEEIRASKAGPEEKCTPKVKIRDWD
jgi:hypothetical protein